jgi:hypothetical protein
MGRGHFERPRHGWEEITLIDQDLDGKFGELVPVPGH